MDAKLAEIYGTNQVDEQDLEKMAAAELAEQLSDEGGVEVSDLSDEQVEALAQEVLAAEAGEGADENQEKLAEADYLGRVMAHAYAQEIRNIEKTAMEKVADDYEIPASKVQKALHSNQEATSTGRLYRKGKGPKSGMQKFKTRAKAGGRKAYRVAKKGVKAFGGALAGGGAKGWGRVAGKAGSRGKVWAARGAVGALAGGAAYKAKESSALDTLAEQRAFEILEDAGLLQQEYTKVASIQDMNELLQEHVELRAIELLDEAGFELFE